MPDRTSFSEAMEQAKVGFRSWSRASVERRAACLDDAARRLEAEAPRWLRLLQTEAGKTLPDAVSEWREAIDFLRYYAAGARQRWSAPRTMPGPTGEDNRLHCAGRGVFVCISPWNFPLAIFIGQVAAALVAGNSVLAKPAEQTPLIATEAVALLHRCGVPEDVLRLVPGDGETGAALVALPGVAGVAFTGSTAAAASINRALAAKDGPIAALIAETGGINAMIVDATALPEQVSDDVVASAFRSAGQRCSALRLLCLQEDVADRMIAMIAGAARELKIGDPRDIGVDIGPVIDAEAKAALLAHIESLRVQGGLAPRRFILLANFPPARRRAAIMSRRIFSNCAAAADLKTEIFGPILHMVRYKASELDSLARRNRGQWLWPDARGPFAHRWNHRAHPRPPPCRQLLCQPQYDRRGRRHAAVRRLQSVRDRAESRRPALSWPLCDRAHGHDQHRGRWRQCKPYQQHRIDRRRPVNPASISASSRNASLLGGDFGDCASA